MRPGATRLTFATAMLIVLWISAPAAAQSYIYHTKYCAREYDGATDCSYYTLWQCRMAVSATGGDCAVNPRFVGDPPPRHRKVRRSAR